MQKQVKIKKLNPDAIIPTYAREWDAGADLYVTESVEIWPGEHRIIGTGIAVEVPVGFVGLIHPRSGLAAKSGVTVLNTPGTIDAGYRGELKVILINLDKYKPFTVNKGDRIAQFVLQEVAVSEFVEVEELSDSVRQDGGFGSSGQ
jgi:dUTP pyrophosphatase